MDEEAQRIGERMISGLDHLSDPDSRVRLMKDSSIPKIHKFSNFLFAGAQQCQNGVWNGKAETFGGWKSIWLLSRISQINNK